MAGLTAGLMATVTAWGVAVVCVFGGESLVAAESPKPQHRWQFSGDRLEGRQIKPTHGPFQAALVGVKIQTFDMDSPVGKGPIRHDPANLAMDGNSKAGHRVVIEIPDPKKLDTAKLPTQAITVETWARVDQPLEWGGMVGALQDNGNYERGWLLGYRKNQFCFAVAGQGKRLTYLTAGQSYSPGNWYHVVGTYDGKQMRLYVDGNLANTSKAQKGAIVYPPKAPFVIGAYKDDNEQYTMRGSIESVAIYEQALTASQIRSLFDQRKRRFPGIEAVRPKVVGWPTYLRDNVRSGQADESLNGQPRLKWTYRAKHAPSPAWPPPAKQDFWHDKYDLKPRVTYDRAFHLVTVRDIVCFGSSTDDQVRALDARTGKLRWTFFTEGPVRLAPTIAGDYVLFGSDDGYAYCVDKQSGKLIWKHRLGPSDHRIVGNGRVISAWPVRSSVLVDHGVAYFCAGLFPSQGVWQGAVDIRTGKLSSRQALNISPQGYIERRGGQVYTPTGRDPKGAFISSVKRGDKPFPKQINKLSKDFPHGFITVGSTHLVGGDDKVAAFDSDSGNKLWELPVEGQAHSLAMAHGQLFVGTDKGVIHCFSSEAATPSDVTLPSKPITPTAADMAFAKQAVALANSGKGYALVRLGDQSTGTLATGTDAKLAAIAAASQWKINALLCDASLTMTVRRSLSDAGLYGRVAVQRGDQPRYTDYLFNAVLIGASEYQVLSASDRASYRRIVRPDGGVLLLPTDQLTANVDQRKKSHDERLADLMGLVETDAAKAPKGDARFTWRLSDDRKWLVGTRGPLPGVGEWSHMYANAGNTVCSTDERVGGAMALQWFGRPGPRNMIDRHHRTVAPLMKRGRLFIPGDNRIIAADAYNGTQLWDVVVPDSRRIAAFRDCSHIVAGDDFLFAATAHQCIALDAQTGEKRLTFEVPSAAGAKSDAGPASKPNPASADTKPQWGYIAQVGDMLYGSATASNASRRKMNKRMTQTVTYWDFVPIVGSNRVFAYRKDSPVKPAWVYEPKGLIVNPTFAVDNGRITFVECVDEGSLARPDARGKLSDLMKKGAKVVSLDGKTGKVLWTRTLDLSKLQHNLYLVATQGRIIVAGSRNSGTDRKKDTVHYDLHVLSALNGSELWKATQNQGTKIGGDHGEQDQHPVVVAATLYCEPFAYDLVTGKLKNNGWTKRKRHGCGNISASAKSFFFRQSNPTMFDLASDSYRKVTTVSRPGCWINMIPAGGLLLIPEASSGCTCNYAIQSSMAFIPVADRSQGKADRNAPPAPVVKDKRP